MGFKQGRINSPGYFGCYLNGLTKLLLESRIGCHIYKQFLAMILFADDLSLLAPTRSALQRLLDLSSEYCTKMGLNFNPRKSKILVFSNSKINAHDLTPINLDNSDIEYCDSIKYLGVSIFSERGLCYSAANDLRTYLLLWIKFSFVCSEQT